MCLYLLIYFAASADLWCVSGPGVGGAVDVRCACDCSELGDEERVLGGEGLWSMSCGLWP